MEELEEVLPTNDLLFKKVFTSRGNEDILKGFVEDFTGESFQRVDTTSPYDLYLKREQDEEEEKTLRQRLGYTVVDAKARSDEGHLFTIEMQVYPQQAFVERALYYLFSSYTSNLGSEGEGNPYQSLRKTYGINICDKDVLKSLKSFHQFEFLDKMSLESIFEVFGVEDVQLTFFNLAGKDFPSEEQYARTENLKHWQDFFKGRELSPHAPDYIHRAYEVSQIVNLSKEERELMTQAERDRADTIALINYFREEGIRRGRKERDEEALYYQEKMNRSHEVAYQLYEVGRIDYGDLQAIVQLDDEDLQEQLAIRQSQHDQGLELE